MENRVSDFSKETLAHIQSALEGNRESVNWIATEYAGLAHRTACRFVDAEEAKDLAHDALLKVITQLDRYSPSWKFSTWVITITRNTCIDWIRKQKRVSWREIPDVPSLVLQADESLEKKETTALIRSALNALPPLYREVIEMHHFQDLKYREIASNLDIPIGTVMNRIFRARKKMKATIELQAA